MEDLDNIPNVGDLLIPRFDPSPYALAYVLELQQTERTSFVIKIRLIERNQTTSIFWNRSSVMMRKYILQRA
jgi:hypothetical protein